MHRVWRSLLGAGALLALPVPATAAGPPAGWSLSGQVGGFPVRSIVVDPSQPLRAVAVAETGEDEVGALLVETTDGGATWRRGATRVNDSPVDGPLLVTDGGAIWLLPSGGGQQVCTAPSVAATFTCPATAGGPSWVVAVPGQPGTLVSVDYLTVRRSVDGGATWSVVPTTPTQPAYELVADPTTPGGVYGVRSGRPSRSVDGGLTWTLGGTNAGQCSGLGSLAVDPTTPGRVFAADGTAICRSTDYGTTWQRMAAIGGAAAPDRVLMTADGVMLASTGVQGQIWRSTDAATTWTAASGLAGRSLNGMAAATGRVYVATDVGVFVSTDGGATFQAASSGLPTVPVTGRKVFHYGTNTVYSLEGPGVLRSTDGGATWERRSYGVGVGQLYGVDRDGVLYADISAGGELARSGDGGLTFERLGPLPAESFPPLVISPADPSVMYLSDVDARLYISRDGGRSWSVQPMKGTVRNIAADAGDPMRLYAAMKPPDGTISRIAVSGDGGRTWKRFGPGADDYLTLAHPTQPGVVVALAKTTLYVSRNGGRSFTPRLLGFFPKLYRNEGFVGAFAGDALVVSGSWGPERKYGVAATIQKDGGLIASGDLGQSWTWYPTSLTSVAIGSVQAGDGQILVNQRILKPDTEETAASASRSRRSSGAPPRRGSPPVRGHPGSSS